MLARLAARAANIRPANSRPHGTRSAEARHRARLAALAARAALAALAAPQPTFMPRFLTRKPQRSAHSSITLVVGLPAPCPAFTSMRISTGWSPP